MNWLDNEPLWNYQRELPAGMPDWLRSQYRWTEDDTGNGRWNRTNLRDSQGRSVVPVGPSGENYYQREGDIRNPSAYRAEEGLGNVTDEANFDPSRGRARRAGRERTAMSIMAAMAAAGAGGFLPGTEGGLSGALGELGLGSAPAIPDSGLLNAADWTVPAADGTLGSWAGTGLEGAAGAVPTLGDAGMLNAADYTAAAANPTMAAAPNLGGGLLSQAGQYLSNLGPRGIMGGASALSGLLGGRGNAPAGGNGWRPTGGLLGNPGGSTGFQSRSTYQPNPYTVAQLQQLYGR